MYAKARRLYPVYAAVVLMVTVMFGTVCCIYAKNVPEESYGMGRTQISAPAYSRPETELARVEAVKESVQTVEPETADYILNVPLTSDLQKYIHGLCEEYEVPFTLIIAMIEQESSYRAEVISKTNDYGLMQINTINHKTLEAQLGITDFLDPEQNCSAGIYMIAGYYSKYEDANKALMAYNLGETGAKRQWNKGKYSTAYSESVLEIMSRLEEYGE